ncbi:TPA: hypothetical protein EYP84_05045, partial [Candidatus Bipolaricaulota bacterium]|nr:hypothetical protein [Candidatus Bipolaricaulota bacterium]
MDQQWLMLVEATGIQPYLFGSNQLAQNIGASELVRQATEDWVHEFTQEAKIVYAGGGNAMLIFDSEGEADAFARKLTRRALEQARGLDLVVKRKPFDPAGDSLADVHQELRKELARRKRDRHLSTPLAGLGVTAACVYTGAPAVDLNDEGQLISVEVQHKRAVKVKNESKDRLKEQLPQVADHGYDFVYDFDQFGARGESSYLAVIHTDGNRIGERIKAIGQQYARPEQNEQYRQALADFSQSVENAAYLALNATVDALLDAVVVEHSPEGERRSIGKVPLRRRDHSGPWLLPFRPIVFGGDDVTFVCEGRLGLAVAAKYLQVFSQQILSDGEPAYCRGGVAVVKSHYPFSRAYDLAEALCASAKWYINEANVSGRLTAMDWHFAVSGLVLPIKAVRRREYTVPTGNLLMRPLRLNPPDGDWRSWRTFTALLDGFDRAPWAGRRSKIKALRDALRGGREATQHFLTLHGLDLPEIPGEPELVASGWHG